MSSEKDAPGFNAPPVVAHLGVDVNHEGGRQSRLPYRMDLIDPSAMIRLALIHYLGSLKYGDDNWRKIPKRDHLNHALVHIYRHLAGLDVVEGEDHLGNAMCRLVFACALDDSDWWNIYREAVNSGNSSK